MADYDVVVVGAGPNGLAAAIVMARAGRSVLVLEAKETIGGGAKTEELTLPGFLHDTFSAIHPLGLGSPFFAELPLEEHGLSWIQAPLALAHPFDDREASVLDPSLDATAANLGPDGPAYIDLMAPFVERWTDLAADALGPLGVPRHPIFLARFGIKALRSAEGLVDSVFRTERAKGLVAGIAAHATVPLERRATAAFALVLMAAGHAVGWPFPRGGSGSITSALAGHLRSLGGDLRTGTPVRSLADVPSAPAVFYDLTPRQLLGVLGDRIHGRYRRELERFRYGPGVFKLDWVLSEPIPWRDPECARAGTIHLGGSFEEIARSERESWRGTPPTDPYVIVGQPTPFDPTRSPDGRHVAWGYCHVPHASEFDMTERLEMQIERFAPGFRDTVVARHRMGPAELESRNPNLVGGDINGGSAVLGQLFFRPAVRWRPHRLPLDGMYLCSSSTPPGGGVHGMCGYHAAQVALKDGY